MRQSINHAAPGPAMSSEKQRLARRNRALRAAVRGVVEVLEERRLLSVATAWVNDNWIFGVDQDGSGGLSQFDTVTDANEGTARVYGFNAFGSVTGAPDAVTSLEAYDDIDDAIANLNTGGTVNVFDGAYDETVSVTKALTLQGGYAGGTSTLTVTDGANQALVTVAASDVSINGFTFDVQQPYAVAGVAMAPTTANPYNNLTVAGNTFTISGAATPGAANDYVGFDTSSTAIAVRNTGGTTTHISITGNTIGTATDTFDRAIFLRTVGGLVDDNTVHGDAHDLAAQFVRAPFTVSNNQFLGYGGRDVKGAQVDITEAEGAVNILGNNFAPHAGVSPSGSSHVRSLMIKNSGNATTISGNTFAVSEVGILSANSAGTVIDDNTFNTVAGDTSFTHVQISNKVPTGGALVPRTNSATITNNDFGDGAAAGGTAVEFLNHNSAPAPLGGLFGPMVVSGNSFELNLASFIRLDNAAGASNTSGLPNYAAYGNTTMAPFSGNITATGNLFDVGAGLIASSGMGLNDLFAVEDKITHATDTAGLGFVRVNADQVYVTPGSGSIQRGIDAATAGDTVNVDGGTYSESLTITKAVTVAGQAEETVVLRPTAGGQTLVTVNPTAEYDDATNVTLSNIDFVATNGAAVAARGVVTPNTAVLNTLSIEDSSFTGFTVNGLAVTGAGGEAGGTGLSARAVIVQDTTFDHVGSQAGGGTGPVNLYYYNGDATFRGVTITNELGSSPADGYRGAIQLRGVGSNDGGMTAMGNVVFEDVDISGDYRHFMIGLQRYTTATADFTDVALGGATSSLFGGFGAALRFDLVGSGSLLAPATVDLGNTVFRGLTGANAYNQVFDLEFAPDNSTAFLRADATGASWVIDGTPVAAGAALSTEDAFVIENRILHYVDKLHPTHGTYKGFADIKDGNVYVTARPDSSLAGNGSIQRAIAAADTGDTVNIAAGTYAEHITVDKDVDLVGAGAGSTTIAATAAFSTPVVSISASGASEADPLTISNLTVQANLSYGVQLTGASMSNIAFEGVTLAGTNNGLNNAAVGNTFQNGEFEIGLHIGTGVSVDGLTFNNGTIRNFLYGYIDNKTSDAVSSTVVTNANITNSSFIGNLTKGFYSEKLTNSVIDNVTFDGNGWYGGHQSSNTAAAIDINLKNGNYGNLVISNSTFTNNAQYTNPATDVDGVPDNGAALQIKARDDSPSYSGFPATLSGVQVLNNTFTNQRVAIRIGEAGKANAGPTNVTVAGADIVGSTNAGIIHTGGTLTLNDVDFTSAGGTNDNATDLRIIDGAVSTTIGDNVSFGGNTFYIENLDTVDPQNIDLSGNAGISFDETSNYRIEDKMHHKVDAPAVGKVTWVAGNVYVTNAGTDSSIQQGIDAADVGDTVNIEAGTYDQAVVVNKGVTLDGDGTGLVTMRPSANNQALIDVTAVDSIGDIDENVTIRDINFAGANGALVADYGVRLVSTAVLDTLTIENADFTGFRVNGVAVFGQGDEFGGTGLSARNVVIDTATFDQIGAGALGGTGAINVFFYNGNATFRDIVITNELANPTALPNSYRGAIQVRGVGGTTTAPYPSTAILPMGDIVFDNVDITGDYRNYMITLQRYSDASVTFTDVSLGGATSSLFGGFGAALRFDAVGSGTIAAPATVDLGNTNFRGLTGANAYTAVYDLEFAPDNAFAFLKADGDQTQWNGLGAVSGFTTDAEYFAVENRVLHYLDKNHPTHGTYKGLLELDPGTLYLNANSASIQNAIDVATAGDTIKLASGTFSGVGNRDINLNKDVDIVGQGAGSTTIDATGGTNGINVNAGGLTLSDFTLTSATGAGLQFSSAVDDVDLTNLTISNSNYGVNVASTTPVTNLALNNTTLTGNTAGFRVAQAGRVDGLDITGGSITDNQFGIYAEIAPGSTGNDTALNDVNIDGTSFSGNTDRAIYLEKLSNATFNNLAVSANTAGTAVDLNLKGGDYENITLSGGTYSNSGTGSVVYVKARNDAPGYDGNPASLTGLVLSGLTLSSTGVSPAAFGSGLVLENNITGPALSDLTFAGTGNGVLLSLLPAQTIDLADSAFDATLGNYVINATANAVTGTAASYGGLVGQDATDAEAFDIVDKIVDGVDATGLGLVRIRDGEVFVTTNSFQPLLGTTAASIQRGVNVATVGNTVNVEAGTYNGMVAVNKALVLRGAQAGVDARNRTAAETIITGEGMTLQASGITVDGFQISGVSSASVLDTGMAVSASTSGHSIVNNIFRGNVFGMYLNSNGTATTTVQNNWFDSNNLTGSAGGSGIYSDGGASKIAITENLFTGHTTAAINFAGAAQSDISITRNTLTDDSTIVLFRTNGANIAENVSTSAEGSGVYLGGGNNNVTISSNEITSGSGSAVTLDGGSNTNVTIVNNKLDDNDRGIRLSNTHIGSVFAQQNSLTGNSTAGIANESGSNVNAENNWWGQAGGPTSPLNTSLPPHGDAVVITGSGTVDFTPWLTSGAEDEELVGFQPTGGSSPIITLESGDSDSASLTETNAAQTASGTLTVTDADTGDTVTATVASVAATGDTNGVANEDLLGYLSVNSPVIDTNNASPAELTWTFNSGTNAFDYLADGETLVLAYTIEVSDGTATVSQVVTVTLTGTNDAPTITVGADDAGTITEGPGTPADTGSVSFTDLDTTNTLAVTHNAGSTAITWSGGSLTGDQETALRNGFSIVPTTFGNSGTVNWTYAVAEGDLNFLSQGETVTFTVTLTVTDTAGATVTQDVDITINGTNDTPTITGANDAGEITEGATLTDTGAISFADLDQTDTLTVSHNGAAAPAVWTDGDLTEDQENALRAGFSLDQTSFANSGTVNWTYTVSESTLDFLSADETVTLTYTVTVTDGDGATVTQDVTITITGSNDTPVITAADGDATINEGSPLTDTGAITFADVDQNDLLTVSHNATSTAPITWDGGELTGEQEDALRAGFSLDDTSFSNAGTVNWTYSIDDADLDFLEPGQTVTFTVTVTVTDSQGATDTQDVIVTIGGANDAPTITAGAEDAGSITEGGTLTASGIVSFTDADQTDTLTVTHNATTTAPITWSEGTLSGAQEAALRAGFSIAPTTFGNNGSVTWTYTASEATLDFLSEGETVTFVVTLTVTDSQGDFVNQDVTITITGDNDGPTIGSADGTGAVAEGGTLTDTGAISFSDLDQNDTLTASHNATTAAPISWSGGTLLPGQETALRAGFSLDTTSFANSGTVNWTYTASEATLDFLAEGETVTFTVTVTITDSEGATATQDVLITITGDNDGPTIDTADDTGTIAEGSPLTDTGAITFSDLDQTDTLTASHNATTGATITWSGGTLTEDQENALRAGFSLDNASFATNSGTANWTYTVTEGDINFLHPGETVTFTVTVTIADELGALDTQDVVITITGANDVPTIGGTSTGAVTEDVDVTSGNLTAGGTLTIADDDQGESTFVPQAGTAGSNGYGTFTLDANGNWTYTADNSQTAIQQLRNGESISDSFIATSFDGTATETVTVTINGTNDTPVANADVASATEAGGVANGTAGVDPTGDVLTNDTDADNTDTQTVTQVFFGATEGAVNSALAGSYGSLTLNDDGTYSYTVDNNNATVQALRTFADTLTEVFTYTMTDAAGAQSTATLTVTLHGANDNPVANDDTASATEAGGVANGTAGIDPTGDVLTNDTDVDAADGKTVTGVAFGSTSGTVGSGLTGDFGTLTLNADGSYSYAVDNSNAAVQALRLSGDTLTDTFTYTVTDTDGGTATASLAVTIQGANDNPVVTLTGPTTVNEGSTHTYNYTVADPDGSDSFSVIAVNGGVQGTVSNQVFNSATGAGSFDVTFADDVAVNTVSVQIQDASSAPSNTSTVNVQVDDVLPTYVIDSSSTTSVNEGSQATVTFRLVDPGAGDLAALAQVSINWNDGSAATVINSGDDLNNLRLGQNVTVFHTYADDFTAVTSSDVFTINFTTTQSSPTIVATNIGTGAGSAPNTITVNNLAPTGAFTTSTGAINAGQDGSVNWVSQADVSPQDAGITGPGATPFKYIYFIDNNNNQEFDGTDVMLAGTGTTYVDAVFSSSLTIDGSYFETAGTYHITSWLIDNDNGASKQTVQIDVAATSFQVESVTANASGFDITFNRAFTQNVINLYANDNTTPADVTVFRGATKINGSLIFSTDGKTVSFIATGGFLADGAYTITVRSAADGFTDLSSELLDGDQNGTGGDNHVAVLNIANAGKRILSLPDFARGPGQRVEVLNNDPANGVFNLPITINAGANVTSIDFKLVYDSALLNIDQDNPFESGPAGWTFTAGFASLGGTMVEMSVTASGPSLATGSTTTLFNLRAAIPWGATYGASQALRITDVEIDGAAGLGDNAVQVYAYLGDLNGTGANYANGVTTSQAGVYTGADTSLIQRRIVNSATGFTFYNDIDSIILADFNGTGSITGADTSQLQSRIVTPAGIPRIPVIPAYLFDPFAAPPVEMLSLTSMPTMLVNVLSENTASTDVFTTQAVLQSPSSGALSTEPTTPATPQPISTVVVTATQENSQAKEDNVTTPIVTVPVAVFSARPIRR